MAIRPTPRPYECSQCGQTHNKCIAHNKTGGPCDRNPADGADVCPTHGGHAPQVVKAAKGRVLDYEVRKLLNLEDIVPIHDPYTALAELAGETVRLKDILLAKVEELTDLKTKLFTDKGATEQIDVVFAAYERALDRCDRILSGMARLDLEDRIAKLHSRINGDAVERILTAMNEALDDAGITGNTREVISLGFGARLRGDKPADRKSLAPAERATAALVEDSST